MNSLPLHPVLVHIPLALAMLIPAIAAGFLLAWLRGWLSARSWLVVVALQTVLVAGGFIAMQTGGDDEERVETVVPEGAIEGHEEAAEVFVWSAVAVLVLALAGLLVPSETARRLAALATVLAAAVVLVLGLRVGHAGGTLVYRYDAARAWSLPAVGPPPAASPAGSPAAPPEDRERPGGDDDDD